MQACTYTHKSKMAPLLHSLHVDAVFFQYADVGLPKLLLLPLCARCHASSSRHMHLSCLVAAMCSVEYARCVLMAMLNATKELRLSNHNSEQLQYQTKAGHIAEQVQYQMKADQMGADSFDGGIHNNESSVC